MSVWNIVTPEVEAIEKENVVLKSLRSKICNKTDPK